MVLNKKIEPDVGKKCRPRYFGPMVVAQRLRSGAYRLAEVNGALSKLKFAAFRLIPYRARSKNVIEVTESHTNQSAKAGDAAAKDKAVAAAEPIQRQRLVLQPCSVPVEVDTADTASPAAESENGVSDTEAAAELTEGEASKKIAEDSNISEMSRMFRVPIIIIGRNRSQPL
ncbi:hypothetical protein B0H34DRAFT_796100 [Crassisporium funariophilum]|nr:hypothetical protein B0H34DRAFT_796100 [Crassisporium funariophilum]